MNKFEITVNPLDGKKAISLSELSDFLRCFERSYALASYYYHTSSPKRLFETGSEEEINRFKAFLLVNKNIETARIKIEPLMFESINTNSPLKFIGYCSGVSILALSLSVAIAGGEVDLTNKTFKVNSLSEAVGNYRQQLADIETESEQPTPKNNSPRHSPGR